MIVNIIRFMAYKPDIHLDLGIKLRFQLVRDSGQMVMAIFIRIHCPVLPGAIESTILLRQCRQSLMSQQRRTSRRIQINAKSNLI